mgnify:CR=1 FL=1
MKKMKKIVRNRLVFIVGFQLLIPSYVYAAKYDIKEQKEEGKGVLQSTYDFSSQNFMSQFQLKDARFNQVYKMIMDGKFAQAENELINLMAEHPNDGKGYVLLGTLNNKRKKNIIAKQNFKKAIQIDRNNVFAYLGLVKIAIQENDLQRAEELSKHVIDIDNKAISAYGFLSEVAFRQGDLDKSEKIILKILKEIKGNLTQEIKLIAQLGRNYFVEGKLQSILQLSEELAGRFPNNIQVKSMLAVAQIINDQEDKAIVNLQEIVAEDDKDIKHRLLLAKILAKQKNKETEFKRFLSQILILDAKNIDARFLKVSHMVKLNRNESAFKELDSLERDYPESPKVKEWKGDWYFQAKDLDRARQWYQVAYDQQPTKKRLDKILKSVENLSQQKQIISFLVKALEKNKKNSYLRLRLASLFVQNKDEAHAIQQYKEVLAVEEGNIVALNNLAQIYINNNNPEALVLSEKAYQLRPQIVSIIDTYGMALIKAKRYKQGLIHLRKAAAEAPNVFEIQLHLAQGLQENGKQKEAVLLLERLVKQSIKNKSTENAEKLLKELVGKEGASL